MIIINKRIELIGEGDAVICGTPFLHPREQIAVRANGTVLRHLTIDAGTETGNGQLARSIRAIFFTSVDNVVIEDNVILGAYVGILGFGNGVTISHNRIEGSSEAVMEVRGDDSTILSNDVSGTGVGIHADGAGLVITKNTIAVTSAAIEVPSPCLDCVVVKNVVSQSGTPR